MANKTLTINAKEQKIIDILTNSDKALTLAQISEIAGEKFVSGNINALLTTKGKVMKGEDAVVDCIVKKKVATYTFGEAPKANAKINDTQKAILQAMQVVNEDGSNIFFTLEEISGMVGKKLVSGNIVSLIKNGYIEKGEDKVIEVKSTKKVGTYQLA